MPLLLRHCCCANAAAIVSVSPITAVRDLAFTNLLSTVLTICTFIVWHFLLCQAGSLLNIHHWGHLDSLKQRSSWRNLSLPSSLIHSHHWMLVIICIKKGGALFFDSLGGGYENVQGKGFLSVAYRTLNLGYTARKSLKWETVEHPRQPGEVECGHYVMMYMHQIITLISQNETNLQKHFSSAGYSQDVIDDVRETWCRFFIDYCV